jgi:hypothetical protein
VRNLVAILTFLYCLLGLIFWITMGWKGLFVVAVATVITVAVVVVAVVLFAKYVTN